MMTGLRFGVVNGAIDRDSTARLLDAGAED